MPDSSEYEYHSLTDKVIKKMRGFSAVHFIIEDITIP